MASEVNYSPLHEDPTDRLDFDDSVAYPQDDGPYPNAGNPRVQAVGHRDLFKGARSCSKLSAVMLLCMVILAIVLISVIASLARPKCIPSVASTGPPTNSAPTPAVDVTTVMTVPPTPPATATNGRPFPWTDIRLPKTLQPTHYDLTITTDMNNFRVSGVAKINFRVITTTDAIVMHAKNLTMGSPKEVTTVEGVRVCGVTEMLIYEPHEQVYFGLDSQLNEGQVYTIAISFNYPLADTLAGYYLSSYIEDDKKRYIASTQFEPTAARQAFPCFDEPALKATFALKMIRARELISLFNTGLINKTPLGDDMVQDEYNTTVPMSTYLVAFVVCDFVNITNTTTSGTIISVYTSPGKMNQAHLALDVLQKTIPFYENFFGIKYPLSKQDMIAIPDFSAGAMENWGLITYREESILYQEGVTSADRKQWIVETITHELAHQWFGNLVTMEWWNDLWLNEGFASYVQYIGTDNYNKEWQMMDQFALYTTQTALDADSKGNSHPISVPVADPNEINAIFDSISYDKGSSILRMLHDFLPEGVFVQGLHTYLTKYQFRNALTGDLWNSISKVYKKVVRHGPDIADMMDTWTLQMGYPLVTMTRNGPKVTVTQEHFLHSQNAKPSDDFTSPYNYKWTIPLTYITANNATKTSVTMNKDKAQVQFSLGANVPWFKANSNQSGFYRVNYDADSWNSLTHQLMENHSKINVADRANLVDDVFSLAWAGHLEQTKSLDLSLYLTKETEYGPLNAALTNLNIIGSVMRNTEGYSFYVDYVLKLLTPQLNYFKKIGWEAEGTHLQKFLKRMVIYDAITLGHKETVANATKLFRDLRDSGLPVQADLRRDVYCAGVMYGDRNDWDFCWERFNSTIVASEKRVLLSALACTFDPFLINRYLYWAMDEDKIPTQNLGTVISSIASHSAGAHAALSFVIENWHGIVERFIDSPFEISYIIQAVTSSISRQFEYDQAAKFFMDHFKESHSGKRAVEQALENMEANIAWLKVHRDEVTRWFKAHTS